jgi:hypothetical protein
MPKKKKKKGLLIEKLCMCSLAKNKTTIIMLINEKRSRTPDLELLSTNN